MKTPLIVIFVCAVDLFLLTSLKLQAQIIKDESDELAEETLPMELDDEESFSMENVNENVQQNLELNLATDIDLASLNILSAEQIRTLLSHRKENGDFLSIYELQSLNGFDESTIRRLIPYIRVRPPSEVIDKSLFKYVINESDNYALLLISQNVEKKAGFTKDDDDQRFRGSPQRVLVRVRSSATNNFSFGLTAEKDEGERFSWDRKNRTFLFDYISFHAQLKNKGRIKNIIVGDYQCQFGQGLTWGGGNAFGKGAETILTLQKPSIGIIPYTSSYEAGRFHGLAVTYGITTAMNLSLMGSIQPRDAGIAEGEDFRRARSIQTTGLHRNMKEMSGKHQLKEQMIGGALEWNEGRLHSGVTAQLMRFNADLAPRRSPYNQFAFHGRRNLNAGGWVGYSIHNVSLFGEFSRSVIQSGSGWIIGSLISLSKKLDVSLLYRNHSPRFQPFYTNAFSESTRPQNEEGLYWGWKYKFNRRWQFSGYIDYFRFPWLRFRAYSPGGGSEILVRTEWKPARGTTIFVQLREEVKQRNSAENLAPAYSVGKTVKRNIWLNVDYKISPELRMKSRVQACTFKDDVNLSKGLLAFQDVILQIRSFRVTARYAIFDTDSYDARLYAYENDVWLSYSLPPYFGKGVRKYLMLQWKANRSITFWLRYANTRFVDRDVIGSGVDLIEGNTRNDIKFETRVTF
jgi:DNA uptake protein ComE-like DNA-binding protein